jgi:hypothetical protein
MRAGYRRAKVSETGSDLRAVNHQLSTSNCRPATVDQQRQSCGPSAPISGPQVRAVVGQEVKRPRTYHISLGSCMAYPGLIAHHVPRSGFNDWGIHLVAGLGSPHDLICREAAPLSRALLSELNRASICSARAKIAGSLLATPSLRWSLLKYRGVAGTRLRNVKPHQTDKEKHCTNQ